MNVASVGLQLQGAALGLASAEPSEPRREVSKAGRNEMCPCGSGKKYKKCCGGDGGLGSRIRGESRGGAEERQVRRQAEEDEVSEPFRKWSQIWSQIWTQNRVLFSHS
jgi:hypothetical protein